MATLFSLIIAICVFIFLYYIFKSIYNKYKKYFHTLIVVVIVIFIIILIIAFPQNSVNAATDGLHTWFNIVLPSLLPFFIISELLIGLGVVDFIGAILKPFMTPLFRVPGEGAFPLVMSITSGYPVGIKLVAKLRKKNVLTRDEAQRLSSFCSTSGPLFMIGAVAIGMFNNQYIGSLIAIAHYLAAITVGLLFRFYGLRKEKKEKSINNNLLKSAFIELFKSREKDNRSIGNLLGDAVKESFSTMFIVGGFIILYSVIIEILTITNLFNIVSQLIFAIIHVENLEIIKGILSGVIEMTNGCKLVSEITNTSLIVKVSIASFLIGWSGFSIHSQVASFIGSTDINMKIYLFSKFLHGVFATAYTYILFTYGFKDITITSSISTGKQLIFSPSFMSCLKFSIKLQLAIITFTLILSLLTGFIIYLNHLYRLMRQ